MSDYARFIETWADGQHVFNLDNERAREFEEKNNRSLYATMANMTHGSWRIEDVREVIRLALIGGGAPPSAALMLVSNYVEKRPLAENTTLAVRILEAAFFGQEKAPGSVEREEVDRALGAAE